MLNCYCRACVELAQARLTYERLKEMPPRNPPKKPQDKIVKSPTGGKTYIRGGSDADVLYKQSLKSLSKEKGPMINKMNAAAASAAGEYDLAARRRAKAAKDPLWGALERATYAKARDQEYDPRKKKK